MKFEAMQRIEANGCIGLGPKMRHDQADRPAVTACTLMVKIESCKLSFCCAYCAERRMQHDGVERLPHRDGRVTAEAICVFTTDTDSGWSYRGSELATRLSAAEVQSNGTTKTAI